MTNTSDPFSCAAAEVPRTWLEEEGGQDALGRSRGHPQARGHTGTQAAACASQRPSRQDAGSHTPDLSESPPSQAQARHGTPCGFPKFKHPVQSKGRTGEPQPAVTACVLGSSPAPAAQRARHPAEGHQTNGVPPRRASVGRGGHREAGGSSDSGPPQRLRGLEEPGTGAVSPATGPKPSPLPAKSSGDQAGEMERCYRGQSSRDDCVSPAYGGQLGCRQSGPITATTSLGIQRKPQRSEPPAAINHICSLKPDQIQCSCWDQEVQLEVPGPAGKAEAVLPLGSPPGRLSRLRKGEDQLRHSVPHFISL